MQSLIPTGKTRERNLAARRMASARYRETPRTVEQRRPLEIWEGFLSETEADAKLPFCLVHDSERGGKIEGRMLMMRASSSPSPVAVKISESGSYAADIGPYISPATGRPTIARVRGRIEGNRINGSCTSAPIEGGEENVGRFTAIRVRLPG